VYHRALAAGKIPERKSVTEAHEAVLKVIAIFAALLGLWLATRSDWVRVGRRRDVVLASLTALGAAGYINFGAFHTDRSWLHIYDQYHHVIGSKYFPEVGYDGLYAATLLAYQENDPAFVPPARVRDLSTREKVSISSLDGFVQTVRTCRWPASPWPSLDHAWPFSYWGVWPVGARGALLALFRRGLIHANGDALYAPVSALLLAVLVWWTYTSAGQIRRYCATPRMERLPSA
jgi:hypothetical protein